MARNRFAKIKQRFGGKTRPIRDAPGKLADKSLPDVSVFNLGSGRGVGALTAGIITILEDTVGVPFGASVDIVNTETLEEGMRYTVNVNSPTQGVAEARAFIDSSTGFLSYITDEYDVESAEVVDERIFRDTYQFELVVR